MKRIRHLWILCLALATGTFVACVNDPLVDDPVPPADGGTMELRLNVVIPGNSPGGSATRAIGATEENTIQSVSVLAFRIDGANETYDYQTTATLAPNNVAGSTTQTFIANLRAQSYQQRFVVVTNAASLVGAQTNGVARGTDKATVLANLRYDYAINQDRWAANSPNNYGWMPMWGESAAETITSSTRSLTSTVYLMRMVARIDVRLDTSVAGLTNQFKLKSVDLYNTNRGGRMVPDASKVVTEQRAGQTYLRVNATSIPTAFQPYSARTLGPINYIDFTSPGVPDVSMVGAIYTFEADAATANNEATCIVVGGVYGTDAAATYYRVEFFAAGTQTRLAILRNHQYIVNITGVQGRGFATSQEAFNSPAYNMTAQVLQWNFPGMDNIAFNGRNHLATDKQQVNLFANEYTGALATDENVVQAITDIPAGWTLGPITNGDGTGTANWVHPTPTAGEGGDFATRITINADANSTGAERTAIVNLVAGPLRLPVRVVQSNQPAIALNVVDSNNQEIQELVFSAPAGVAPTTQQFNVTWLPASNPVNVNAARQMTRYEFPNPGGNPAVNDGAPYLYMPWPERTGLKTFNVSPPALTAAELNSDPFIEKSSRFDFQVSNGYTTMTKSIRLRQLYYNLLVEPNPFPKPYFPMDGTRYAYNVRSNTTFRISNIVETPRVSGTRLIAAASGLDNVYVGATGGPVTTPGGGWREYLTTNGSARGMSGYADVTYSSDKNPAQFQPVTRRLFFPAAQFNIFSICLMNSNSPEAKRYSWWSGSGPSQPPATDHDVHTMTNGPTNYNSNTSGSGTSDTFTSTVPVQGIGTYGLWVGGTTSASSNGTSYSGTTVTTAMIQAAVDAKADMLVISGDAIIPWNSNGNNPEAQAIYDNFLAKDKPVLICLDNMSSIYGMWVAGMNAGKVAGGISSSQGTSSSGPTYRFLNISDPILEGPFRNPTDNAGTQITPGSLQSTCWGADGSGITMFWPNDANDIIAYSNGVDQNTNSPGTTPTDRYTIFRAKNMPLIVVGDGGFLSSYDQNSASNNPVQVNISSGRPDRRSYGGVYSRWTHNAYFIANVVAWAIQRRTTQ